ncbi:MAG: SDR family oxidoreductase, partial [Sphingobacteriales bacterium]
SEINVGDVETLSHTITQEDMDKFVQLTGDDNKLHVDKDFAGKTQFKKQVVHGMLGASFISTVIGTKLPGDGALWFSQTLEFLLPVRLGDQLSIVASVIKKNDKEQIIELKTEIFNQNKQVVTKGVAKVKVIALEQPVVTDEPADANRPKTALVIGGTGGIGKAVCMQLAKDGFQVVVHFHSNKQAAEQIKTNIEAAGGKAVAVQADILKKEDIHEMIVKASRALAPVDVLVNCAATVIPNIKFMDLDWEDYQKQIDLNIKSTMLIIKEVLPAMMDNKYGKIVTVGSLTVDKPNADWSHYITAKAALTGFTKSLAFELAPKGIRINMVTPGMVSTELTADIPEKIKLLTAAQTPLRRLALAKDVADTVSYLCSEKSDFLTGENIRLTEAIFQTAPGIGCEGKKLNKENEYSF